MLRSVFAKRLLGAGVITGAVLIIVLGTSAPNPFAEKHVYYAEFDSVQGLGAIDRDVRVAGVNVGRIISVERDGDNAIVELDLEQDIQLHTDARVELRPHTLFEGSDFADLRPGSPSAPPLEEGATIPLQQTSVYVSVDEATRLLRKPIRESIRKLAAVASKTLRGKAVTGIQKTLKAAPGLTRELGPTARALQGSERRELARSISGMAQTVDAVAQREDQLVPLTQRANRTLAALTVDGGRPLDAALAALPGALEELNAGAPALTALVDDLDRFAVGVTPALPDLTVATHELTPLIDRTIPVVRRATPLVRQFRTIGARIKRASPVFADLVGRLLKPTTILADSVLPALHEKSQLGLPVYLQLMSTFTAANATLAPYETKAQDELGAGHTVRLGGYLDPNAFDDTFSPASAATPQSDSGLAMPPCDKVATLNPSIAHQLQRAGECSR